MWHNQKKERDFMTSRPMPNFVQSEGLRASELSLRAVSSATLGFSKVALLWVQPVKISDAVATPTTQILAK